LVKTTTLKYFDSAEEKARGITIMSSLSMKLQNGTSAHELPGHADYMKNMQSLVQLRWMVASWLFLLLTDQCPNS